MKKGLQHRNPFFVWRSRQDLNPAQAICNNLSYFGLKV